MKLTRIHVLFVLVSTMLLASAASTSSPARVPLSEPDSATRARLEESFGKLPLYFVENQGQVDDEVAYYVQGSDKTIYFTPTGVTFALTAPVTDKIASPSPLRNDGLRPAVFRTDREQDPPAVQRWAVKLDFLGANPNARPVGLAQTEAIISYFKGQPDEWHTGLPAYSRIVYHELWPGIDLVYYGTVDRLKYEFVVQPGADLL